jgi:CubicO group peptidase (beta-lactamase class C family)
VRKKATTDLKPLMAAGGVPGLAIGIIREGKTVGTIAEGVRNTASGIPVDAETVFEAASLTKPVFAYAVLQLIDAGALALDDPLCTYVPEYLPDDPQATAITVRSVLSHTTGLPNWRSEANPLRTYFVPSARFSYSGEGFVWLQRVVERVTGDPLEAVMDRLVLGPLGMNRSGLIWRPAFDKNYADPHDAALVVREKSKPIEAKSASTLHTTASDYALFLRAVLSGLGLSAALARAWLDPQIALRQRCVQCLGPLPDEDLHLAWGLGWGLEPEAGTFFQWGDNGAFKAFAIGSQRDRTAVVVLTNGARGMSIMPELIGRFIRGERASLSWLEYPHYDAEQK